MTHYSVYAVTTMVLGTDPQKLSRRMRESGWFICKYYVYTAPLEVRVTVRSSEGHAIIAKY